MSKKVKDFKLTVKNINPNPEKEYKHTPGEVKKEHENGWQANLSLSFPLSMDE